jgi:hypothetical protein
VRQKVKAFRYPDEERLLLSCAGVPHSLRFLYGFLAREGMRKSEALADVGRLDLKRGTYRRACHLQIRMAWNPGQLVRRCLTAALC